MAVLPSGDVLAAGTIETSWHMREKQVFLKWYSGTTGQFLRSARVDGMSEAIIAVSQVVPTLDGGAFLLITSNGQATQSAISVVKVSPNGAQAWRRDFDIGAFQVESPSELGTIAVDSLDQVTLGIPNRIRGQGFRVVKFDAVGATLFDTVVASTPFGRPQKILSNQEGDTFVLVSFHDSSWTDAGTKYSTGVYKLDQRGELLQSDLQLALLAKDIEVNGSTVRVGVVGDEHTDATMDKANVPYLISYDVQDFSVRTRVALKPANWRQFGSPYMKFLGGHLFLTGKSTNTNDPIGPEPERPRDGTVALWGKVYHFVMRVD